MTEPGTMRTRRSRASSSGSSKWAAANGWSCGTHSMRWSRSTMGPWHRPSAPSGRRQKATSTEPSATAA
ncbi:Uncharacterised protein [Bordetella pertussis]|nr:Uncharacterised protein [Bordetella pertussis]